MIRHERLTRGVSLPPKPRNENADAVQPSSATTGLPGSVDVTATVEAKQGLAVGGKDVQAIDAFQVVNQRHLASTNVTSTSSSKTS